ncbi:MAG TPA: endo-1,4-beta-xylanase [Polyangiaceae bacterium]
MKAARAVLRAGIALLLTLGLCAGCIKRRVLVAGSQGTFATMPTQTLRQAAAHSQRRIGTALATWFFQDPDYTEVAGREFDSLTPENQMKWDALEPKRGKFTFDAGDQLVRFAEQNHMRMRGHTLVWHQQLAHWVSELSGTDLHAAMLNHVRGVCEHYRGRIAQWDVVNEAIDDTGALRPQSPFSALGPTFIDDAFRAAHEADPNALLFYNDYEIEGPGSPKTEGAYALVARLVKAGVPIHGVGFQMHVEPRNWPNAEAIRGNLQRFADLGLFVEITEMDVPVGELPGDTDQKLAEQKRLTREIVAACLSVERCTGITLWGFTDKHTWLNDAKWGALRGRLPHRPLPFDENYRSKPMFDGILEAFAGVH